MVQRFEWSTSGRARDGERCSGDGGQCLAVGADDTGAKGWVVTVVDGLGHGPPAEAATGTILDTLVQLPFSGPDDIVPAFRTCHEAARPTRGAVMAIAHVHPAGRVTWAGVGNVEAMVCRPRGGGFDVVSSLVSRAGVVGYRLPELRPQDAVLGADDLLVLHTDGLAPGWVGRVGAVAPSSLAATAVERFADGTDDAYALVGWLEAADDG